MPTHVANHISTTSDFSPHTSASKSQSLIVFIYENMAVARPIILTWIKPIEVFDFVERSYV
jgi:hypothetical protein